MTRSLLHGVTIAGGVGEGPLVVLERWTPASRFRPHGGDAAGELERLQRAVATVSADLDGAAAALGAAPSQLASEIVAAHGVMLRDPELRSRLISEVVERGLSAESAVESVLTEMAQLVEAAPAPELSERGHDLRDLARRLGEGLATGRQERPGRGLPLAVENAVVALPDPLPSVVVEAQRLGVCGMLVERGTAVSHGAILARSFGIPMLRVPDIEALRPFTSSPVLLDAVRGELVIDPPVGELERRLPRTPGPEVPKGGELPARLWLSIVDPGELEQVRWTGLAGVGLYRTETLFLSRPDDFPSEEEQLSAYRRIFALAGDRPVTVRTLDVGGDKVLEHMTLGPQENPYLGLRAHRLYRFHPELLVAQLRAVLRAAVGRRLRLLFPMVETLEQWQGVQELVDATAAELRADGVPHVEHFERGVLVETPSAALDFERLVEAADFASVGSNDLVQYLFAVERSNPNVADLYQPEHPVVLQLLARLAKRARRVGKVLSVCGEIAADATFAPLLVGLGITDLAVAPASLPPVAEALAAAGPGGSRGLAEACLAASGVGEVRRILGIGEEGSSGGLPSEQAGGVVDPVCGMSVEPGPRSWSVTRRGERHWFCSRACMTRFVADEHSKEGR